MRIDWWTLALQAINVVILVWLLARFLFRPVMGAIAARQTATDQLLADAETAKTAALKLEADLKAQTDAFAADGDARRTALLASIEAERSRLLDAARTETDAKAKLALASVEDAQKGMATQLEEKAAVLAGQMASALLHRLPAGGTTDMMFAALLERIERLPVEERRALAGDTPLAIVTPSALDGEAQARCVQKLAEALPGLAAPNFTVDPALIAGFELHGPHMLVRNSWRADLDTQLAALKEDDHAGLRG